jgi:hypothetical protein
MELEITKVLNAIANSSATTDEKIAIYTALLTFLKTKN